MAILKGGGLNEGSLLRRTLLHVGTFAIGALAIVTILSFTLTSIAKSLLPSHAPKTSASASPIAGAAAGAADSSDEDGASSVTTKPRPRISGSKRPRGGIVEEESPTQGAEK